MKYFAQVRGENDENGSSHLWKSQRRNREKDE